MQSTRSRLALIGIVMVYATLLANALISYLNVRRLHDNSRWVTHTHEVLHAIDAVFTSVVDVETAQRGYITTGEPSYLKPYENATVLVDNKLENLAKLAADNPRQQQSVEEFQQQVARKLTAIREIVAVRRRDGFEAAQALIFGRESRRAMEALRDTISRMEFRERRLLTDRQTQSEVSYWTAVVTGSIAGGMSICLALMASALVWREMETRTNGAAGLQAANKQLAHQAEEVARVNQSLHAEIAERKRIEEVLHEGDQRKDHFLATLAHELRNPLSPLMSAAQLLALEPGNSPEIRDLARMMLRQVEQIQRLIEDLLDISRISRGKLQLRREPVLLSEAISAALDVSRPLVESEQHTLRINLPEQPLTINGDKVRLAQIVGNLLINAAKYTPARGQIELSVSAASGQATIKIRDNGIGIAPDMLPRIFGLFTQIDSSTTRTHGGLGIGLPLAKTLVEMHGGSICAASAGVGQGSEFTVCLPLAEQPFIAAPTASTDPNESTGDAWPVFQVLVVDDNESASHLLRRLLEKLGQEVRVVHSAATALDLLPQWQPDLVISDIAMPEISGYELAKRIRVLKMTRQLFLVALTGYGQESDRQEALAAGFDEHLTKPIGLPVLRSLLETIARRFESIRGAR